MTAAFRSAWRGLRGRWTPFALGVVFTLGIGIALASATGVIARAVAFAGLPVDEPERVVVLWGADRAGSLTHLPLTPTDIVPLAATMQGVATVVASDYNGAYDWTFISPEAGAGGVPVRMRGTLVGGTFFQVLRIRPILGRALRSEDDVVGASRVVVLGERVWRTRFGGDSSIIGRVLHEPRFGASYTVVGVVPEGLDYPRGVDFWSAFAPTAAVDGSLESTPWSIDVVARLAPGASAEQARQVVDAYYASLGSRGKEVYAGARASVRTLPDLVNGDVRPVFGAFALAGVLALLVSCGNAVSMCLVRATQRERELAVRTALGAARDRLTRELLAEVALLTAASGVIGVAGAAVVLRVFLVLAPKSIPRLDQVTLDWSLMGVVLAACTVVLLVVGLAPVLVAARTDPARVLSNARDVVGAHAAHARIRRLVVASQVAMAIVVMFGAIQGTRSLSHQRSLDLGLSQAGTLAFVELTFPSAGVVPAEREAALEAYRVRLESILERVRATPGIAGVAPLTATPFAGSAGWDGRLAPADASPTDTARRAYLNMEVTNADFLAVTGVALRRGRWIASSDRESSPRVVVLSDGGAQRLFPGRDAVGQRVALWAGLTATVVGVVADTRYREFLTPRPTVYFPFRQFDNATLFLVVRAAMEPSLVVAAARRAIASVDPTVLVNDAGTMGRHLNATLAPTRLLAAVLTTYAAMIVMLALTGLYAVMAGGVAARRREFGVRAALGATPQRLHRMVLGEGFAVVVPGAVVGAIVAAAVVRWFATLFPGVDVANVAAPTFTALALVALCATAASVPAWRAGRADPARELRAD